MATNEELLEGELPITYRRFYIAGPEEKSLEMCKNHGLDHAAYGWSKQLDPRWSREQRQAYLDGYELEKLSKENP